MEVAQVISLANWYDENVPEIISGYQGLKSKLDHNATQPQKQPLLEELENLEAGLSDMSFSQLTKEELDLLKDIGALRYLGLPGAQFVRNSVTTSDFDPATAASEIGDAFQLLNGVMGRLDKARSDLLELRFDENSHKRDEVDHPLIRVRFKEGAAIDDVALLKKWAADWYDITRGAAISVGETPQSVKVVGASNGSVIVTLGTIASVTVVLAIIAKNAGRIAHEYLKIANSIEDLRHKKLLNKAIEKELVQQQSKVHENGVEDALDEIKEKVPEIVKSELNALRKSVEKYFDFYKKGGDVDFIPPHKKTEDADENEQGVMEEIAYHAEENTKLLEVIEEVRKQDAAIKQITNHIGGDGDHDE